jgi:hypothetical protein
MQRGTQKPPPGALVDAGHPLAQSLIWAALFNEGAAQPRVTKGTTVLSGSNFGLTATGTPLASSNRDGACRQLDIVPAYYATSSGTPATSWPTTNCTICVIRRKTDTTNRAASLFALVAASGTNYLQAQVPSSDGVVYWDFGGTSSPNRLTVSGLSFSTTEPERWIFTAGSQGSAIWQNGVKVASQSTAVTRTALAQVFRLGAAGAGTSDNMDLNYFAMYATQWSDELCRWWSAEPYAAFMGSPVQPAGSRKVSARAKGVIVTSAAAAAAAASISGSGSRRRRHYPYFHSGSF